MNYKDMYRQAEKNGEVKKISSIFKKEWKKNEEIIGRLVTMEKVKSPKFEKEYFSYLFNTDEGNIKTALGAGVDQEVRPFMVIGEVYRIQYLGTQDTGKGNPMKIFKVEHVVTDVAADYDETGQVDLPIEE